MNSHSEDQPHAVCHQTQARLRDDLTAALRERDTRATADEHIGQAIRRLTQPGQRRRTIRISELRDRIDSIDAQPQPIRPCGHCLGDPPTNHQCPACGAWSTCSTRSGAYPNPQPAYGPTQWAPGATEAPNP